MEYPRRAKAKELSLSEDGYLYKGAKELDTHSYFRDLYKLINEENPQVERDLVDELNEVLAEKYFKLLTSIEWSDELLVKGLEEGLGKFISNLYIKLLTGPEKYTKAQMKLLSAQYVSEAALKQIMNNDFTNLVFEHVVPKKRYIQGLLEKKAKDGKVTIEEVYSMMSRYWVIATVTKAEDEMLDSAGLRSKMPESWNEDDIFARYRQVGIKYLVNPYFREIIEGSLSGMFEMGELR